MMTTIPSTKTNSEMTSAGTTVLSKSLVLVDHASSVVDAAGDLRSCD